MENLDIKSILKMKLFTSTADNGIYSFIYLLFFEKFFNVLEKLSKVLYKFMESKFNTVVEKMDDLKISEDVKTVLLSKNFKNKDTNTKVEAIVDYISKQDSMLHLSFIENTYLISKLNKPFKISKKITCNLTNIRFTDTNTVEFIEFVLTSTELTITEIKAFIDSVHKDFELNLQNKLGEDLYYFDQFTLETTELKYNPNPDAKQQKNYPKFISFVKNKFHTNRTFDNIFFEEKDLVRDRVLFFKNNKSWYDQKGIPYTLGIMMNGQAGCGKTSTIKTISNELKRHVINVSLDDIKTKTQLKNLFYDESISVVSNNDPFAKREIFNIPINKRLYVFEDLDAMNSVVKSRKLIDKDEKNDEKKETEDEDALTLSSLLNILDGTLEIPGRIIVITTNHPENLDSALIRPGRIDLNIHYKLCNKEIIKQMVESFYSTKVNLNADKLPEYILSPAEVNRICFKNFNSMNSAIEEIYSFREETTEIIYKPITGILPETILHKGSLSDGKLTPLKDFIPDDTSYTTEEIEKILSPVTILQKKLMSDGKLASLKDFTSPNSSFDKLPDLLVLKKRYDFNQKIFKENLFEMPSPSNTMSDEKLTSFKDFMN